MSDIQKALDRLRRIQPGSRLPYPVVVAIYDAAPELATLMAWVWNACRDENNSSDTEEMDRALHALAEKIVRI